MARGIFGQDRVSEAAVARRRASTRPPALAEAGGALGEAIGSGGVLVTGSVVTVGEARAMLRSRRNPDGSRSREQDPRSQQEDS